MENKTLGRKITVFLTNGSEYGPKVIEIGNWNGIALYTPNKSASEFLKRDEFKNCGIYILRSVSDDESFAENVYIGEAEQLDKRIKEQLQDPDKDFSEILAFTSRALTKAHVRYLESRIIDLANNAKTANVTNKNQTSVPFLPEAEISDMDYFLEQVKLILPLMGYKLLLPTVIQSNRVSGTTLSNSKDETDNVLYKIKDNEKGVQAKMYESDRGFIVLEGSKASLDETESMSPIYKELRQKLISDGTLVLKDDYYEFLKDVVFNSISRASNVILGRQSSGPISWVTESGETYKDFQANIYN